MLFNFLKYLQPVHYFLLSRRDGGGVFPILKELPNTVLNQLEIDNDFTSEIAKFYDASWQAIQKGYIGRASTIKGVKSIPLKDQYRFTRKYFSKVWVFFVLIIRLLSLKNPYKELRAWFITRQVNRSNYLKKPIVYKDWDSFNSELVNNNPKVGVIIPTLNRYGYLKDVLTDLEQQDYKNFEVIVVDQSEPFDKSFYSDFKLNIDVFHQREKALWMARNSAIKIFKGEYLLFFDDDSRVDPNWISNHLKCLDFFKADASSGVSISEVGAKTPEYYSFFRVSDQLDTGNVLIKRNVFEDIGLFDRQFEKQRMGDGEFGLRMYLNGYLNVSNPYAKRLHLKVGTGGLRAMGSWDAFRTNSWFSARPIPSVLYFFRRYYANTQARWALLRTVPLSIMPYRFKKNKPMILLGVFISILVFPLVLFQVLKSWRLSGLKLKQGPLIDSLDSK